jgi:hypothetical protein
MPGVYVRSTHLLLCPSELKYGHSVRSSQPHTCTSVLIPGNRVTTDPG